MPRCMPTDRAVAVGVEQEELPAPPSRGEAQCPGKRRLDRGRRQSRASGTRRRARSTAAISRSSARASMSCRAASTSMISGKSSEVGDGAVLGALGEAGVLGEEPARVARLGELPVRRRAARARPSSTMRSIVCAAASITMRSPSRDERDRPTVDGFGRDVADAEAVRPAGEAAVGDERGVGAAPDALHRAGDREHLAHPGPALRALVADDDDVAGLDLARRGSPPSRRPRRRTRGLRRRSAARRSRRPSRPRPCGASEPRRTAMPPCAWIGVVERVHDLAVGRGRVEVGEVLGHRLAGDREAVAVEQARVEQLLASRRAHRRRASRSNMWNRPCGFMSAMCGTRAPTRLKSSSSSSTRASLAIASRCSTAFVEPPSAMTTAMAFSNASLVRIWRGRMPSSSWCITARARLVREVVAPAVDGCGRRTPGQAHPEGLGRRRHRVGGEHARARALGRARPPLDLAELVLADRARRARPDRLEHADDVERLVVAAAREDRTAVQEDRREVEPGGGHEHAGEALVAAGERAPCRRSARRA